VGKGIITKQPGYLPLGGGIFEFLTAVKTIKEH
jgi:hypothetical protein